VLPLLVILALGKEPWSRFGIVRFRWMRDLTLGLVILVLASEAGSIFFPHVPRSLFSGSENLRAAQDIGPSDVFGHLLFLLGIPLAAFAEELVFRGYLIPRLERLLESSWAAVLVSTVLFASYHIYQGPGGFERTAIAGFIYGIAFCGSRRLWPVCIAHAGHNFIVYLLLLR
jgi:membrane protease YdiL (CAAX protease family)